MEHENFSVVYSGTIVQADLLKCLLESADVYAVLENEFIGMIRHMCLMAVSEL
jgi:hypothetical protein